MSNAFYLQTEPSLAGRLRVRLADLAGDRGTSVA
jgi:hypothetical protein